MKSDWVKIHVRSTDLVAICCLCIPILKPTKSKQIGAEAIDDSDICDDDRYSMIIITLNRPRNL